ncbi:hypothetical protein HY990_00935 [Candidatus Micrarchaeota archaeon]|nr:hypothetical protein [Candidatus Micrarchaeota archaeon]
MEIKLTQVVRFIELRKKKSELEFVRDYYNSDVSAELTSVTAQLLELSTLFSKSSFELYFPSGVHIEAFSKELASYSKEDLKSALSLKSGPIYDLFRKRGELVKRNFENRYEVAKLNLFIHKLSSPTKAAIFEAIAFGKIEKELILETSVPPISSPEIVLDISPAIPVDAPEVQSLPLSAASSSSVLAPNYSLLSRLLSRCGIFCTFDGLSLRPSSSSCSEVSFVHNTRLVWLPIERKQVFDDIQKKITAQMPTLHLKNAQKQIEKFTDVQEKEFEDIQANYLRLINEKEAIVESYLSEDVFVL